MQIDFFDPYPYRALEPDLQALVLGALRLDAAVAFVTRPGIALLRQYLKTHPPGSARLVASVRLPPSGRRRGLRNRPRWSIGTGVSHVNVHHIAERIAANRALLGGVSASQGRLSSYVLLAIGPGTTEAVCAVHGITS